MLTIHSAEQSRDYRRTLAGPVALVPTMGALHQGHLSLVEHARRHARHVIVSIFVNPTQFGPGEDLARYPRTLEQDLLHCEAAGVDMVFAPTVEQMYPPQVIDVLVDVPALTQDLEGAHRSGHFAGVCRIVAKLFNLLQPDIACFGQKDYQQFKVIEAMATDLMMPVRLEAAPTLRETDGLAMSSRNRYLAESDRHHALGLYKALLQAKTLVEAEGETDPAVVEQAMRQVLDAHHLQTDYAVVRHPQTLAALDCIEPKLTAGVVALIAASLGPRKVRLIDNMVLGQRNV